jgi:hypothetical protein
MHLLAEGTTLMLNTFESLNIDKAAKCLFKELMTALLHTFIKDACVRYALR